MDGTVDQPEQPEIPATDAPRLSPEMLKRWKAEVARSERLVKADLEKWQKNVKNFASLVSAAEDDEIVFVNKTWPRVKQKLAQLFFKVPEVVAKPRHEAFKGAAPVYSAALNDMLNRRMSVAETIDEVLTDLLSTAGIGVSVIGYESITEQKEAPVVNPMAVPMGVDPVQAQPLVDKASPQEVATLESLGVVTREMVSVPVYEEWYWERISPAKFLRPASFRGSNWDKAPWLGYKFEVPLTQAVREKYGLPKDFEGSKPKKDELLVEENDEYGGMEEAAMVTGQVIWYKAYLYDDTVKHPCHYRRLVLIDGLDERPGLHEDSPYQAYDPQTRKYLGVDKNPIRVLTLTYVPDKAIPPADAQITKPQAKELVKSRTLMMEQRQRSLPIRWADVNMVDEETEDRLRAGDIQSVILTNGPGDRAFGEITRATYPRESHEADRIIEGDMDQAWSMSANQYGGDTVGRTTAREVGAMENAIATRLEYERTKVQRWFVAGCHIVGALMQRFHTAEEWVEVVGQDGAKVLVPWNNAKIAGDFAFELRPDTALRVDVVQEREDSRNLYNFLAKDPMVNRRALLERVIIAHGSDPTLLVAQQPPEKGPDPANLSMRISGEDLNPLNPSFPLIITILSQSGYKIDPKLVQAAMTKALNDAAMGIMPPQMQSEHGGLPERSEVLSKHSADGKGMTR